MLKTLAKLKRCLPQKKNNNNNTQVKRAIKTDIKVRHYFGSFTIKFKRSHLLDGQYVLI